MMNRLQPPGIAEDSRVHLPGSPRARLMKKSWSLFAVTTMVPAGPLDGDHATTGSAEVR